MIKVRGKVLLIIFLVIIALAAAALFLAGRYLFRYALDTDSESFIKSGRKEDMNSSEEKSSYESPLVMVRVPSGYTVRCLFPAGEKGHSFQAEMQ